VAAHHRGAHEQDLADATTAAAHRALAADLAAVAGDRRQPRELGNRLVGRMPNRHRRKSEGATGDRITRSGAASLMSSPAEGGHFPAANSGAAEPASRLLSAEDSLVESGASDATGDPGSEQATALELKR
jgi:hypothetical protein